jgi:hypothetical protein
LAALSKGSGERAAKGPPDRAVLRSLKANQ